MQKIFGILAVIFILLGCASEREYKEIRDLRMGGQLAESRNLALSVLKESPKNLSVWRELSRTDLEYSKKARIDKTDKPMAALVEGSLICAGMYQFMKQKPDARWKQASLLAYAEVNAHLNVQAARLSAEIKLGNYLSSMYSDKSFSNDDGALRRVAEKVTDAQAFSRELIKDLGTALALAELLPETNGGTTKIMAKQIDEYYLKWIEALSLEKQTMDELLERAKTAVKSKVKSIREDLELTGHFEISSITENGIY